MMSPRRIAALAAALAAALLVGALVAADLGSAQALGPRITFQILTGSTGGTYFPVGQLMAGLLSHPPGVDRCEGGDACGPPGLIISARSSDGAVENVLAVNAGRAESGLAQGDVVAQAVAGTGTFRHAGKQTNIRVVADLFVEDVHLLAARGAKIASVADLKGKRVSLGADSSGTAVTARAVLAAYGIPDWRMKTQHVSTDAAAELLRKGQLDAFFFVGGRPVALVDDLISRGAAKLVPIDGKGRDKLLKTVPALAADIIPAGTYRGMPATPTVGLHALWIVNAHEPEPLVYGLTRALFNSANRDVLSANHSAGQIRIATATLDLPAPLHPGAMHYYRDIGHLKH
jgi:TRAP transporter TAXI family solute receptor